MATDRSPFVAIGDSLLDEPWDFETKAVLVMLSCHMHARWRAYRNLSLEEVAAAHPISKTDLMKITGKGRLDVALTSLRRLADVASMSVERRGDVVWISWPKWAIYNGLHSRSGSADRPLRNRNRRSNRIEEESAVEATAPPAEPAGRPPDQAPLDPPSEPAASAEREPPERRAAQPLPLWSYTAADRLIERVRGAPGGRIPPRARSTWAAEIARMPREIPELGAMERPEDRVLAAIEWLFGPENSGEYALVVRSGRALREKWPRIVAAAKRARAKTQPREDLEAWARGADHLLRRAT